MQNGAQFYLQVVGTQTNNTDVKFGSNWIYTANGTGGSYGVGSTVTVNTLMHLLIMQQLVILLELIIQVIR